MLCGKYFSRPWRYEATRPRSCPWGGVGDQHGSTVCDVVPYRSYCGCRTRVTRLPGEHEEGIGRENIGSEKVHCVYGNSANTAAVLKNTKICLKLLNNFLGRKG